jgi:hypothetical protein
MMGPIHLKRFMIAALVGAAGLILALVLGTAEATTIINTAWIALASTGAALLLALWGAYYDPNRDLAANRLAGEERIRQTLLTLDSKSAQPPTSIMDAPHGSRTMFGVGLGLVVVAMIAVALPPSLVAINGWTTNSACVPEVAGPGDKVRFYLPKEVSAVKGMYNGSATATATYQDGAEHKIPLEASTKTDHWGDSISGKSLRNSDAKLRADVKFPPDPALANRTLRVDMEVKVKYPHMDAKTFDIFEAEGRHSAEVSLSDVGAGRTFQLSWWGGQLTGVLLIGAAWLVWGNASKALVRRAHPTLVAPVNR